MSITQEFLRRTFDNRTQLDNEFFVRPRLTCSDGFSLSIQAGDFVYCSPRKNITNYDDEHYESVEVGFPYMDEELLYPYAESEDPSERRIYPYVPVDVVDRIIEKNGGIKGSMDDPYFYSEL